MAINPAVKYPTKTAGTDADYPYGIPRNVSAPGAGDGTPWEVDVVKDIFAFQQVLLTVAGVTPSGNADTVPESQYLESLGKVSGRAVETTTAILTTDCRGAEWIESGGYAAQNDGGGALWRATGTTTPGSAGTTDFPSGLIYDEHGTQFEYAPPIVNPRAFGAKGDGVTDDYTAIDAAIRVAALATPNAGGVVLFDAGTYLIDQQLSITEKVILRGIDRATTVLDFTAAGGAFPNGACLYGTGTASAIPDLNATVAEGDTTLDFVTPHGLAVDDIVIISNPTDSTWGGYALHYRAGEQVIVDEVVDTDTVSIARPLFDGYTAAAVDCFQLIPRRAAIENMTIKGIGTTTTVGVVSLRYGRDVALRNVALSGSQAFLAKFDRCFGVTVLDCHMADDIGATGDGRGVSIINSQRVNISRCTGSARVRTVSVDADDNTRAVPSREIVISDCVLGGARGVMLAGNCEHVTVSNCQLTRSTFGGNRTRWQGCTFLSDAEAAVDVGNARGYDHDFRACRFVATQPVSNALFDHDNATEDPDLAGVVSVEGCTFDMHGHTGKVVNAAIYDSAIRPDFIARGCTVKGAGSGTNVAQIVSGDSSAYWQHVHVVENWIDAASVRVTGCAVLDVSRNHVEDSPDYGLTFSVATGPPVAVPEAVFAGNYVRRSQFAGLRAAVAGAKVQFLGNNSLNNRQSGSGDANASINASLCDVVIMTGNIVGDDQAVKDQTRAVWIAATVNTLIELGTVDVGNLSSDRDATTVKTFGAWAADPDIARHTGWVGMDGADPVDAFSGARSWVAGNGVADAGGTFIAGNASLVRLYFGDSDSKTVAGFLYNHSNNRMFHRVNELDVYHLRSDGFYPEQSNVKLGTGATAFNESSIRRMAVHGTALLDTDFSLSAGWGASATIDAVRGYDAAGHVKLTASGTVGANPTVTLTFSDGGWGHVPIVAIGPGTDQPTPGVWRVESVSATQIVFQYYGTPVSGVDYALDFIVIGAP